MDGGTKTSAEQNVQMKQENSPTVSKKRRAQGRGLSHKSSTKGEAISDGPKTHGRSRRRKRTSLNDLYNNVEDQFSVMERAGKLLTTLGSELPSFAKCMLPSNVSYSFWLIIPKFFCNSHLPRHDSTVTLVDESGKEHETNYLMERHGLSAGWRGFSIANRLVKGDILVFLLFEPCKLKVHIVRVHGLEVVNAATRLMNLEADWRRANSGKAKKADAMQIQSKEDNCEVNRSRKCPEWSSTETRLKERGKAKKDEKYQKGKRKLRGEPPKEENDDQRSISCLGKDKPTKRKRSKRQAKNYLNDWSVGVGSPKLDHKEEGQNVFNFDLNLPADQFEVNEEPKRRPTGKDSSKNGTGAERSWTEPPKKMFPGQLDLEEDSDLELNGNWDPVADRSESRSDSFSSEVLQGGSESTRNQQPDQFSHRGSLCYDGHLHKGIDCMPAVERLQRPSTVAT